MLTKVDLRDFFEINQGLYGELPASACHVAMMRILVEAFSLAPADAAWVSGGPSRRSAKRNAKPAARSDPRCGCISFHIAGAYRRVHTSLIG